MTESNVVNSLLISTTHGSMRRNHRNILKEDFIAGVKFGERERTYGHQGEIRWKFTFADVVYITEDDCITEVTCYAIPIEIPRPEFTSSEFYAHESLRDKMCQMPALCTSHVILIVDQSSSMRKCDVDNFRTRSDAVFAL
jgi:hypothetical protein